ncbi:hypothetical protein JY651_09680 [Pyxidicoccus parkwayensis]|uniref:Uncharacterized protein n=1 Tax=Pyxidicoccus parkwayensis TaxID=2813578 RepID=A0ABX7P403_9BACT|nr:hypothetical protein [Pyxidicoccus parkwaysis]QSQ25173.1 hypothetical protein JY651_09680 [Pyxidicoccus parkwaysis]
MPTRVNERLESISVVDLVRRAHSSMSPPAAFALLGEEPVPLELPPLTAASPEGIEERLREIDRHLEGDVPRDDVELLSAPLVPPVELGALAGLPMAGSLAELDGAVDLLESEEAAGPLLLGGESVIKRLLGNVYAKVVSVLRDARAAWLGFHTELAREGAMDVRLGVALDGDASATLPLTAPQDEEALGRACETASKGLGESIERYRTIIRLSALVIQVIATVLSLVTLPWAKALRLLASALRDLFRLVRE